MKEKYNKLTEKYSVTAREYFYVLRLAIYHVDHKELESSYAIAQYEKSNAVYACAVNILNSLYEKGDK